MYQTDTIHSILTKAYNRTICLPSIQRLFVWDRTQIEKLLDSIFKGYPIGTFLIWKVNAEIQGRYTFYNLINNYHERDPFNQMAPINIPVNGLEALLDGQQRITALCIALMGSFTEKRPGGHAINPNAYVTRKLYFNLLGFKEYDAETDEEDVRLFKMISDEELRSCNQPDSLDLWHPMSDFMDPRWIENPEESQEFRNQIRDLLNNYQINRSLAEIRQNIDDLNSLYLHIGLIIRRIRREQIISYYSIENRSELEEVAEIFIRTNQGGTRLSKSDLLFSTVVAAWEIGREKIQQLIRDIRQMNYDIDTDFVMRACLYLTDSEILFKVENFNAASIARIRNQFAADNGAIDIREAVLRTFTFLRNKLGVADKTLKSKNVLIPIIYHVYKGGLLSTDSIDEVQKYLYISLLKNVFGSHGDSLLRQLRSGVTTIENNVVAYDLNLHEFNFQRIIHGITDRLKRELYDIDEEDISDFMNMKKGSDGWLVLSLIYPRLNYEMTIFDQDHLHPASKFKRQYFTGHATFEDCEPLKDTVPNLAFLTPAENREEKRNLFLRDFINLLPDQDAFRNFNLIDEGVSLEISDFLAFYQSRRDRMAEILRVKLGVNPVGYRGDDRIDLNDLDHDQPTNDPIAPEVEPMLPGPLNPGDNANNALDGPIHPGEVIHVREQPHDNVLNDGHLANTDDGLGFKFTGFSINGEVVCRNPRARRCFLKFMNFIIDHYSDRLANLRIAGKLIRPERNDPEFGTDAINYPTAIIGHGDFFYNSHTGNQTKKNRMISIANELGLRIWFYYD